MATNFYIRSFSIENFRSFGKLTLTDLKRINVIGGFNGVGKTALLETLFYYMDRRDPTSLLKPLQWRRVEIGSTIDPSQFLNDRNNPIAKISCQHRYGSNTLLLRHETPPRHVSVSIQSDQRLPGLGTTDTNQKGLSCKVLDKDGETIEETFLLPSQGGAVGNISKTSDSLIPSGQILSIATRGHPQEAAIRLSNIVKQRRMPDLLKALQHIVPNLKGIQTLQEGSVPQIYADIGNDFFPIQMLGDGFQNLFLTFIGIMNAKDGVLFLDEMDAALHYSKISVIWSAIARMAEQENCQIFATTHSRECINNAALGVREANRQADFQYLRLERGAENTHRTVSYSMNDVKNAEQSEVEIR